jgi:hypothetical protein
MDFDGHRGLAITVCKASLRIMSDDNLQQDENASQTIKIELYFGTFLLKLELVRLARGIDGTFFTRGSRTLAIWLQLR